MENTVDRGSSQERTEVVEWGVRLVEGFETLQAAEDDARPPVVMFHTALADFDPEG